VLGADDNGAPPVEFLPAVEDFIGEGGTLDWPAAIVDNLPGVGCDAAIDGYESVGGLCFAPIDLAPGQSRSFILVLAILDGSTTSDELIARYGTAPGSIEHWPTRKPSGRRNWRRCTPAPTTHASISG
jgi:hypothetical protein